MTPAFVARVCRTLLPLALLLAGASPAAGQHRARLSADLADHLRAGSPVIDVIVHGTREEIDALAQRANVRVRKRLKSGAVLRVTAGELEALRQDEAVDHLSTDVRYRSSADILPEAIGADQVWAGIGGDQGLSGRGIGVAVIDSGVDPRHAALRGRVAATVDFTGGDGVDRFGHGTHVAALIAGAAGRLAETRDYQGIASGARIVNLRVLGDDGSGLASNVIEAIDWAIDNRRAYDIRVINLSLGAPVTQPYRDDPVCEAVERAVAAGIVVVAAAGNYGRTGDGRLVFGGVTSPANHPEAITVGAVDMQGTAARSDDRVSAFSSRGPTRFDLVLKPDLVAPGSRIVSAAAQGSYLAATYPERVVAGSGANAYIQLSGTSMSAAVVSGAAALLLEQRPRLTPRTAKALLQFTSGLIPGEGLVSMGAGSLNVLAAARLLTDRAYEPQVIHREMVQLGGVTFLNAAMLQRNPREHRFVSALARLVWGSSDLHEFSTIIWGQALSETIIWGQADTIIWGQTDTIIWGQAETIIWGQNLGETIIWGQAGQELDTIIWGQNDAGGLD